MKRRKRCQLCNELFTCDEESIIHNIYENQFSISRFIRLRICDECLSHYSSLCPLCKDRYWQGSAEEVKAILERARTPFEPKAKSQSEIVS